MERLEESPDAAAASMEQEAAFSGPVRGVQAGDPPQEQAGPERAFSGGDGAGYGCEPVL